LLNIAFIGLGAIGLPIARRLAQHPEIAMSIFDVRADVLEQERALGRVATSIADAVDGVDAVVSVLPADQHVLSVAEELAASGHMDGVTFIDFSTISPRTIEAAAAMLPGSTVLGGALTRSVAAAAIGELSIFVGGDPAGLDGISIVLDQMATDVRRVETAAHAKSLKVVNNMMVSATNILVTDHALLSDVHQVDPRDFVAAVAERGAGSWAFTNQTIKHLLVEEFTPGRFSTAYMHKDVNLSIALASSHGTPAWFAALTSASYRGTEALGLDDHYHPIVGRWVERAAGRPQLMPTTATARRPSTPETARVATLLADTLAVQQGLLSLDGLRLARLEGIELSAAIEHFISGSASNDFLVSLEAGGGHSDVTLRAVIDRLDEVLALAAQQRIPAFGIELSRQYAYSLVAAHGDERSLRELALSA